MKMRLTNVFWLCNLIVLTSTASCLGQSEFGRPIPARQLVSRCRSVSLVSRSSAAPTVLVADKLRKRGEFIQAGLILVDPDRPADIAVTVTGNEDETDVLAARKPDGNTGFSKLLFFGGYPGFVASTVIDTLHQLCSSVITAGDWRRLGYEPLSNSAAAQLITAHSLSVVSRDSWIDDTELRDLLRRRSDFKAWQIAVDAGDRPSDLRLRITHDIHEPIVWEYELDGHASEKLLSGSVAALSERHAASAIVRHIVRQFARYRPLTVGLRSSEPQLDSFFRDQQRIWHVKLVTDDPRTTGLPLEVTVDRNKLVARNPLGQTVFNIEAGHIEDVDHSTVRDPVLSSPDGVLSFVEQEPSTPLEAVADVEALAGLVAYTGLAAVLAPFQPREHMIDIAWSEGDFFQQTTFQMSGRDARRLLEAVRGLIREDALPRAERVGGER